MNRPSLSSRLRAAAAERQARQAVRRRRTVIAREDMTALVDGVQLVDFCGNDYLGLSRHLDVAAAQQEAIAWHGVGSGASHLVSGHHVLHEELEAAVAEWMGYPRALLFGSGFNANLAVMQALLGPGDLCLQDKLNHASLIDGARLSGATLRRYPHGDLGAAARQLQGEAEGVALIATDGVFSMDGDVAPLRELALLARAHAATLYVDDAHGVGVLGPGGRGSVAAAGLGVREVPLQLVTFGKALGTHGAAVVGTEEIVEHLLQTARPGIYTTAAPPAEAAATLAALRLAQSEPWRRAKLMSLVLRFRRGAQRLGLPVLDSSTPIQPVLIGDNARTLAAAQALEAAGFWVAAIRPPTVPEGKARLRITLSAGHTEGQVDDLLLALSEAVGAAPATEPETA